MNHRCNRAVKNLYDHYQLGIRRDYGRKAIDYRMFWYETYCVHCGKDNTYVVYMAGFNGRKYEPQNQ